VSLVPYDSGKKHPTLRGRVTGGGIGARHDRVNQRNSPDAGSLKKGTAREAKLPGAETGGEGEEWDGAQSISTRGGGEGFFRKKKGRGRGIRPMKGRVPPCKGGVSMREEKKKKGALWFLKKGKGVAEGGENESEHTKKKRKSGGFVQGKGCEQMTKSGGKNQKPKLPRNVADQ